MNKEDNNRGDIFRGRRTESLHHRGDKSASLGIGSGRLTGLSTSGERHLFYTDLSGEGR